VWECFEDFFGREKLETWIGAWVLFLAGFGAGATFSH